MGNTANAGLAILNETEFPVTCTCSMGTTHRYEDHVQPGQIFYRWPGAVWMTLAASRTTESTRYTDERCRNELSLVGWVFGGSIAAAMIATTTALIARTGSAISTSMSGLTRAIQASVIPKITELVRSVIGLFNPLTLLGSDRTSTSDHMLSKRS